jgi:hypothetical protein
MRRIVILAILTAVCAVFASAPAAAVGASCAVSAAGGENAPQVLFANEVNEYDTQGYSCTVKWAAEVQPQYESGGVWHNCNECPPAFHSPGPDQFYAAGSGHNWSGSQWTPNRSGDTPACSYNWRLVVNFFGTSGFVFQTDASPATHKNC